MELLVIAVSGGIVLGLGLFAVIFKVVGAALDNLLDWLIHTFGNERATKELEDKRKPRE